MKELSIIRLSTSLCTTTLSSNNPETEDPVDLRGDVAKTWTLGSDSLSYTFTLDENAMWHDGTPLTAADVKFSLDWAVNPRPDQGRRQPPPP